MARLLITKSLGMLLLGIWLILTGLLGLVPTLAFCTPSIERVRMVFIESRSMSISPAVVCFLSLVAVSVTLFSSSHYTY